MSLLAIPADQSLDCRNRSLHVLAVLPHERSDMLEGVARVTEVALYAIHCVEKAVSTQFQRQVGDNGLLDEVSHGAKLPITTLHLPQNNRQFERKPRFPSRVALSPFHRKDTCRATQSRPPRVCVFGPAFELRKNSDRVISRRNQVRSSHPGIFDSTLFRNQLTGSNSLTFCNPTSSDNCNHAEDCLRRRGDSRYPHNPSSHGPIPSTDRHDRGQTGTYCHGLSLHNDG